MKVLRRSVIFMVSLSLAIGYAASQIAYFHGEYASYARLVDSAPVPSLAIVVAVILVILSAVRDTPE